MYRSQLRARRAIFASAPPLPLFESCVLARGNARHLTKTARPQRRSARGKTRRVGGKTNFARPSTKFERPWTKLVHPHEGRVRYSSSDACGRTKTAFPYAEVATSLDCFDAPRALVAKRL